MSMQRLTKPDSPVMIAANDTTAIVASHDLVQFFCLACGGLKNGLSLYIPNTEMQEYLIKQELLKQQPRCLCSKREVNK